MLKRSLLGGSNGQENQLNERVVGVEDEPQGTQSKRACGAGGRPPRNPTLR